MTTIATWLPQLIVALISLATGVIAYLRTRRQGKKRNTESSRTDATVAPSVHPPTNLNGYAEVLRQTLDRVEWLRNDNERWRIRAEVAEAQLADCHNQQHQQQQQRQATHTQHTNNPNPPATNLPAAKPATSRPPRPSRARRRP